MPDWRRLGLAIREARKLAGWSQAELGRRAKEPNKPRGLNKETVVNLERGGNSRASTIRAAIDALRSADAGDAWATALSTLDIPADDATIWTQFAPKDAAHPSDTADAPSTHARATSTVERGTGETGVSDKHLRALEAAYSWFARDLDDQARKQLVDAMAAAAEHFRKIIVDAEAKKASGEK